MLKEHVAKDFSNYIKRIFWDSWNLINIYFLNVGIWTFWRKVTPWHLKDYVQNTAIPALAQTPLLGGCSSPGIERVNDGVKIWHGIDLFSDVSSSILFDPFANFVLLVLSVELLQTFAGQVSKDGVFSLRPAVLLPQLVGASPGQILLGVRNGDLFVSFSLWSHDMRAICLLDETFAQEQLYKTDSEIVKCGQMPSDFELMWLMWLFYIFLLSWGSNLANFRRFADIFQVTSSRTWFCWLLLGPQNQCQLSERVCAAWILFACCRGLLRCGRVLEMTLL